MQAQVCRDQACKTPLNFKGALIPVRLGCRNRKGFDGQLLVLVYPMDDGDALSLQLIEAFPLR
jgi:hypothetical protein